MERLKKMWAEDKSVDFPDCFFGIRGYNHVDDKICTMSVIGTIISLISAIACFFLVNNIAWACLFGVFGLFLVTTMGNVFQIRWFYLPLMIVIVFCSIVWTFVVAGKLAFDLCSLNQPHLHQYLGPEVDRTFPPMNTDERVQTLINVVMEFLLLLPVRLFSHVIGVFFKGFLYLEYVQKKQKPILPARIDPFLLSADSRSDSTE